MDALIYQAVVQAGYKGLLFSTTTVTYETLKTAVPEEALEGFIGGAWPVEFDPAATDIARPSRPSGSKSTASGTAPRSS